MNKIPGKAKGEIKHSQITGNQALLDQHRKNAKKAAKLLQQKDELLIKSLKNMQKLIDNLTVSSSGIEKFIALNRELGSTGADIKTIRSKAEYQAMDRKLKEIMEIYKGS